MAVGLVVVAARLLGNGGVMTDMQEKFPCSLVFEEPGFFKTQVLGKFIFMIFNKLQAST